MGIPPVPKFRPHDKCTGIDGQAQTHLKAAEREEAGVDEGCRVTHLGDEVGVVRAFRGRGRCQSVGVTGEEGAEC